MDTLETLIGLQDKYAERADYFGGLSIYGGRRPDAGEKRLKPFYKREASKYTKLFLDVTEGIILWKKKHK